jgi:GNAT superfamily N-acetyltransferase
MGWAFMCASEEGRVSQIRELFVMPAFRKQGLGSYLEGIASQEASELGYEEIHIILNNCDTVLGPIRKTARDFATKRGYSWRWRQIPELGADGFAIKRFGRSSAEGEPGA